MDTVEPDRESRPRIRWLFYVMFGLAVGLLVGLCPLLALLGGLAVDSGWQIAAHTKAATRTASATLTASPTVDPDIFSQAQRALDIREPKRVKEILLPYVRRLADPDDLAQAYRLLGDAEKMQGHSLLAAGHYEGLYEYEPSLENLFLLATMYDYGGDQARAYQRYQQLLTSDSPEIDSLRPFIEERLEHLAEFLKACCNGVLPSLLPSLTPQGEP